MGSLNLEFSSLGGKTRLLSSYCTAPLKVQRPFYPEGDAVAHLVVLHTAGGIVGGDQLNSDIQLSPHSRALITSASAGKVYRSLGAISQQKIICRVAAGACLEWLPQETIIFNGAIWQQQMQIELEEGSVVLMWDINRYGRTASGEKFLTGNSTSSVQVSQNSRLLWLDRQKIIGDEKFINSLNGLAGQSVTGTLALVGLEIPAEIWQRIRAYQPAHRGEFGYTPLARGILFRYRGHSSQEARYLFTGIWSILRPFYLGLEPCKMRIWQ